MLLQIIWSNINLKILCKIFYLRYGGNIVLMQYVSVQTEEA